MDNKNSGVYVTKVLVVGSAATGKTSIIRRFCRNEFSADYMTTIGVDFSLKSLHTDGMDINVQLWDVAGQDRFAGLSRLFYTHAVGAIVVFDIFEKDTFQNAANWKKDIDSKVFLPNGAKIPVILLANKCDLMTDSQQPAVTSEQIQEFCQQNEFFATFMVSAKSGQNIREACQTLINQIVENHKKMKSAAAAEAQSAQQASSSAAATDSSSGTTAASSKPDNTVKLTAENTRATTAASGENGGCCGK